MSTVSLPSTTGFSAGIRLNRTCDACSASKVKCSGMQPCSRCTSRGVDCFYRARKKREASNHDSSSQSNKEAQAKKLREPPALMSPMVTTTSTTIDALKAKSMFLQPHERRSWTVFFTLYKNYLAGCVRCWFERQLARIQLRLEKAKKIEMLNMLREWARSLDVDYEKVRDRAVLCLRELEKSDSLVHSFVNKGAFHLHVGGSLTPCCGHEPRMVPTSDPVARSPIENLLAVSPNVAKVKMTAAGKFPEDIATIKVNPAFEQLFGLSQTMVSDMTRIMGSGLLPWGGDLLCLITPNESDIFAFMQICAINLNWKVMLWDKSRFPLCREVPSTHVIPVMIASSSSPVPCMIKCIHREFLDPDEGLSMEITMTFEPLPQLPEELASFSSSSSASAESMVERAPSAHMFDWELPLADDDVKKTLNDLPELSIIGDFCALIPTTDVFFPEVDFAAGDDTFMKDLLEFARIGDNK